MEPGAAKTRVERLAKSATFPHAAFAAMWDIKITYEMAFQR